MPEKKPTQAPAEQPAPQPSAATAPPAAQAPNIQYIIQEKSLVGIGGWLIFWLIIFGLNAIGALWMFIGGLIGAVESNATGAGLAVIIETMIFGLLMAAASTLAVVFIARAKKLGTLFAYISLGTSALYTTAICITAMVTPRQECEYSFRYGRECTETGQPAGVIIGLVGAIFVAWLGAFLIGLYFKMSKRVQQTLVK